MSCRPKLVQCLCPQRHVLAEVAFRGIAEHLAINAMQTVMQEFLLIHRINDVCNCCGAKADTWTYQAVECNEDQWHDIEAGLDALHEQNTERHTPPDLLRALGGRAYERPRGLGSLN